MATSAHSPRTATRGGTTTAGGLPSLRPIRPWGDVVATVVAVGMLWVVSMVDHAQDVHDAGLLLLPALLLVAGAFGGRLAAHARLPRLTGYIILGAVCGPDVLHLVSHDQVTLIKGVNDLAIGLIALMAGAEIRLTWLRARFKAVLTSSLAKGVVTPLCGMAIVLAIPSIFPFMPALQEAMGPTWIPALMLGFVLVASSPMVVVSVIKDNRAAGPLTEMAMGLAVVKDVVVLLGFTVLLALTQGVIGGEGATAGLLLTVGSSTLFHVLVSILLGIPIGLALAWLSEREYTRLSWLLVGVALGVSLLEPIFHIKPLFCLLSAGFCCENLWRGRSTWGTHHLERGLSQVAAPVFIIFFVAAGLGLHLKDLATAWIAVLVLAATRLGSFWVSLEGACRATRVEPQARRYLWLGMVPQAGVTLGLAAIIGESFAGWGESLRDLLIACVALYELAGPILLTWALKRTGEAGAAVAA